MVVKIAKFKNKTESIISEQAVKKDFVKKIRFKKYKKQLFNY